MWRLLHLAHRWLGIALGLLVLAWLVSGLVMLFVARPELRHAEREQALAGPLATPTASAAAAWAALDRPGAPQALRLQQQLGRPVWLFLSGKTWHAVDGLDGRPRAPLDALQAARLAAAHGERLAGRPLAVQRIELLDGPDQWSVYSRFNAQRPLYKVALDSGDGLELYIGQRSGELVLDTRAWERGWNWLGSVTHWLYFTPLRIDAQLWREVVLWSSGIALGLCVLGLVLGLQRLRLGLGKNGRRYASGSVSPYREPWQRWHHLLGLGGGLVLAAWLFSGWLSMDPWGWPGGDGPAAGEAQRWSGGALEPAALQLPPRLPAGTAELAALRFQGAHFWLAASPAGSAGTALIDPQGQVLPAGLDEARLRAAAQRLQPDATIAAAGWLHEPDLHYYALRHQQRSFPVYRVAFDALDAPAGSSGLVYYLDPRTARVVLRLDEAGRWNRWLFNALHRWDLPPLASLPLARDAVVIALSLLGLGLTGAGLVLGARRLRKKKAMVRPKRNP